MSLGLLESTIAIKKLTKYLEEKVQCDIFATLGQVNELEKIHKNDYTVKVLKERSKFLTKAIVDNCKYVDMRSMIVTSATNHMYSRLSICKGDPHRFEGKWCGVLTIYNSDVLSDIFKQPMVCCPLVMQQMPPKMEWVIRADISNLFVPFKDQISFNRFLAKKEAISDPKIAESIIDGFDTALSEIWAPILADKFERFQQIPTIPKKPDEYICTINAEENKGFILPMVIGNMLNIKPFGTDMFGLIGKIINAKEEKVEHIKFTLSKIYGDQGDLVEEYISSLGGPNIKQIGITTDQALELKKRTDAGEDVGAVLSDLGIDAARKSNTLKETETDSEIENIESADEQDVPEKEPVKSYDDSLDGFFDMLDDLDI